MTEFRVLGPVELWSAGQRHELARGRPLAVLAVLLLTPGVIVPADALIDRLWDARPPAKARESLSVYVARLRAALRNCGTSIELAARAGGYVLDIEPQSVDLHRFRGLRRRAGALAGNGGAEQAALALREADGLWRGPALAGIGGSWMARMRVSLEEERRAAIAERVSHDLALGLHAGLIGELSSLLAQYPLDETFVACQMTALYRSGRQGDALSLYRQTRDHLVEDQGTEPGPALAQLHQQVLRRDPGLEAPAPPGPSGPDTLPPQTAQFTGRAEELAALPSGPGSGPQLVMIEGPPGAGKTEFAIRAARLAAGRYPGGLLYLDFRSHDPLCPPLVPGEALHRLLRMLGVPATHIPAAIADRSVLWRAQLARRHAVVILDDVTRLDQVRPLLPTSGQSLTLITGRRAIAGLAQAQVLALGALPHDDAVALLTRITTPPGSTEGQPAAEVSAAVGLSGRLPLAIHLIAGRIANTGSRARPARQDEHDWPARAGGADPAHPEVTAAFDLSYRALDPGSQRFLRRLGLSPGPRVSSEAAAALAGVTLTQARHTLAVLASWRMVAESPPGQFGLHDLIRDIAAVRAARDEPPSERREAVSRLLSHYLSYAGQADRVLFPFRRRPPRPDGDDAGIIAVATRATAAAWMESQWRDILHAARHAAGHQFQQQCADLTAALHQFLETRGYWDDAIAASKLALQASQELGDPARTARAALDLCAVSWQVGAHDDAAGLAEQAAAAYRSVGDLGGLAEALDQAGIARQRVGLSAEAMAYFAEARVLHELAADGHGTATTLSHTAVACWQLGRYSDAYSHLRSALTLYRQIGDQRGEGKALNNLGKIQLHDGDHEHALASFRSSLDIFARIGGEQNQAVLHHNIGTVHDHNGDLGDALAAYQRALAIYRDLGDLPDEALVLDDIADLLFRADCLDQALAHYDQARRIAEDIADRIVLASVLRGTADLCRQSGRPGEALDNYQAALSLARQISDPYEEAKNLEGIAETTLITRGPQPARIIFRQALDIFERLGVPEADKTLLRLQATAPQPDPGASLTTRNARNPGIKVRARTAQPFRQPARPMLVTHGRTGRERPRSTATPGFLPAHAARSAGSRRHGSFTNEGTRR